MLNKKAIRKLVLEGRSDEVRDLLLCDSQIVIIQNIKQSGIITAAQLADDLCISVQNASSKLTKLSKSGYLTRKSRTAESGGIEFIYWYGAEV